MPPLGTAAISPDAPVTAGSVGTWTIRYTAGSYGFDEGGTIKIAQLFASDWEHPQFSRPELSGYTTVKASGKGVLHYRFDQKGHQRPWMKWCLIIDVVEEGLAPGDVVTVVLGDRSGGSPGIRAQTFQETRHEFGIFVDPTNACRARPLEVFPSIRIVPGPPVSLACILPSEALVGEPVEVFVKAEDRWRNPAAVPPGLRLEWRGEAEVSLEGQRLTCLSPGLGRIFAAAGTLSCCSNPIIIHSSPPLLRHYWGDLHGQSGSTLGVGSEEEYFAFGRDVARLDFTSHQANDFQLSERSWTRLNEIIPQFQEDHRFVVFPGYEWSANTPAGGDRNVFLLEENMPIIRSSYWQVPDAAEPASPPAQPADEFFRRIRSECDLEKVLLGSHAGGRYSWIEGYFDDELGPLVEVVSCWGVFEWLLKDALEADYQIGVMANSDSHKGRPGAEGPGAGQFGVANGLTCVLAASQTRADIWRALKMRRCYGTTGPRIILDFQIEGAEMGSILEVPAAARASGQVYGTAPLESLTLYRGLHCLETVHPPEFSSCSRSTRIRVSWQGARSRGRGRRCKWDGRIELEGPRILSATSYQFDSPSDGIAAATAHSVEFRSHTVGDLDGLDLTLDDASAGRLVFRSGVGTCALDLSELQPPERKRSFEFGGVDLKVTIERYPERLSELSLSLNSVIQAGPSRQAYFLKAVQEDGHCAWSSPIYVSSLKDNSE